MILFPAVDIKNGQCVRLRQGKADEVTVFSKDPLAMALHWVSLGGRWLHVVDLDGAFSGNPSISSSSGASARRPGSLSNSAGGYGTSRPPARIFRLGCRA
jgi:hypothetical protein